MDIEPGVETNAPDITIEGDIENAEKHTRTHKYKPPRVDAWDRSVNRRNTATATLFAILPALEVIHLGVDASNSITAGIMAAITPLVESVGTLSKSNRFSINTRLIKGYPFIFKGKSIELGRSADSIKISRNTHLFFAALPHLRNTPNGNLSSHERAERAVQRKGLRDLHEHLKAIQFDGYVIIDGRSLSDNNRDLKRCKREDLYKGKKASASLYGDCTIISMEQLERLANETQTPSLYQLLEALQDGRIKGIISSDDFANNKLHQLKARINILLDKALGSRARPTVEKASAGIGMARRARLSSTLMGSRADGKRDDLTIGGESPIRRSLRSIAGLPKVTTSSSEDLIRDANNKIENDNQHYSSPQHQLELLVIIDEALHNHNLDLKQLLEAQPNRNEPVDEAIAAGFTLIEPKLPTPRSTGIINLRNTLFVTINLAIAFALKPTEGIVTSVLQNPQVLSALQQLHSDIFRALSGHSTPNEPMLSESPPHAGGIPPLKVDWEVTGDANGSNDPYYFMTQTYVGIVNGKAIPVISTENTRVNVRSTPYINPDELILTAGVAMQSSGNNTIDIPFGIDDQLDALHIVDVEGRDVQFSVYKRANGTYYISIPGNQFNTGELAPAVIIKIYEQIPFGNNLSFTLENPGKPLDLEKLSPKIQKILNEAKIETDNYLSQYPKEDVTQDDYNLVYVQNIAQLIRDQSTYTIDPDVLTPLLNGHYSSNEQFVNAVFEAKGMNCMAANMAMALIAQTIAPKLKPTFATGYYEISHTPNKEGYLREDAQHAYVIYDNPYLDGLSALDATPNKVDPKDRLTNQYVAQLMKEVDPNPALKRLKATAISQEEFRKNLLLLEQALEEIGMVTAGIAGVLGVKKAVENIDENNVDEIINRLFDKHLVLIYRMLGYLSWGDDNINELINTMDHTKVWEPINLKRLSLNSKVSITNTLSDPRELNELVKQLRSKGFSLSFNEFLAILTVCNSLRLRRALEKERSTTPQ